MATPRRPRPRNGPPWEAVVYTSDAHEGLWTCDAACQDEWMMSSDHPSQTQAVKALVAAMDAAPSPPRTVRVDDERLGKLLTRYLPPDVRVVVVDILDTLERLYAEDLENPESLLSDLSDMSPGIPEEERGAWAALLADLGPAGLAGLGSAEVSVEGPDGRVAYAAINGESVPSLIVAVDVDGAQVVVGLPPLSAGGPEPEATLRADGLVRVEDGVEVRLAVFVDDSERWRPAEAAERELALTTLRRIVSAAGGRPLVPGEVLELVEDTGTTRIEVTARSALAEADVTWVPRSGGEAVDTLRVDVTGGLAASMVPALDNVVRLEHAVCAGCGKTHITAVPSTGAPIDLFHGTLELPAEDTDVRLSVWADGVLLHEHTCPLLRA